MSRHLQSVPSSYFLKKVNTITKNLPDYVLRLFRLRVVLDEQIRSSGSLAFYNSAIANFISSVLSEKESNFKPKKIKFSTVNNYRFMVLTKYVLPAVVVEADLLVTAVVNLD